MKLEAVSVMSTSGRGTMTDANGQYTITVYMKDSIYFSYLNKPTMMFPVAQITHQNSFDISLRVGVTELKSVTVMPRNYKFDSTENRKDYAKIFDFRKPGFKLSDPSYNDMQGVGVDLDELINVFRFKRTKRILAFQKRLLEQEQDKFIDHRFNKATVRKLTGLTGPALDTFMIVYRPNYEFTKESSDYDFLEYIKLASEVYRERYMRKEPAKKEKKVVGGPW